MTLPEVWTIEELSKDAPPAGSKGDPLLWGRPGHLTAEECEIYTKFKAEIAKRGKDFKDTVYCFGEEEGEAFALCRWLRARKYDYEEVIKMVEEATETRKSAKQMDFYPEPEAALGCDMSIYFAQYPQLYSGFAKNGCPVFISKPGVLNVDAVECITTIEGIVKFHWFIMMHDFANRLRNQKKADNNFKRFECVCILDLENLTMGQLNSKTLAIIKEQSAIDSVCFPETMNKMYIINGPRFFGATWSLIKGWLDPRTANKIEVISSRKAWTKTLLEYIDEEELPADYGGKGPVTQDTIDKEAFTGKMKRLDSEVLYLRGHGSCTYEIGPEEALKIEVYTRSTAGAKFAVVDAKSKTPWVEGALAKHDGTDSMDEIPTKTVITDELIPGPASIKVKADSNAGRWTTNNFLVVFTVMNP